MDFEFLSFDAEEPYIEIANHDACGDRSQEKKIPVPKALAYYLAIHYNGSKNMRDNIERQAEHRIQSQVCHALGIYEILESIQDGS